MKLGVLLFALTAGWLAPSPIINAPIPKAGETDFKAVYAPAGSSAVLAEDCKMNAEGTKFIEPCKFRVRVEVLKYQ